MWNEDHRRDHVIESTISSIDQGKRGDQRPVHPGGGIIGIRLELTAKAQSINPYGGVTIQECRGGRVPAND